MNEEKYDFTILFDKMDEVAEVNVKEINFDLNIYEEIDDHIKYLKEFYDASSQEFEILTRS